VTRFLLALPLVLAACDSGGYSGPRYESAEDGISFARPPGWDVSRDRATLVLDRAGRKGTIAIRTVPRAGSSEPREASNVIPAVETVLRALPGAHVVGPTKVDDAEYQAAAFDVDFAQAGRHYQRRHITLVAETRIIHVFLVAPAGQLATSRRDLEMIVKSVREEG
jgi:hypothetical protein